MAGPLSRDGILENLELLSEWLEVKHPGEKFELILLGGAALALDGYKDQTRDVDVLEPRSLPEPLKAGIAFIRKAKSLSPEWINTNAANIFRKRKNPTLPGYFKKTSRTIQFGKNLKVRLLGRQGLISTKLLAATPSFAKHTQDLRELSPKKNEIREAVRFVLSMDSHQEFRICGLSLMNWGMTSMRSGKKILSEANVLLRRSWAAMGLPFDVNMIEEKKEGVLDVEALLIVTLLSMGRDRMVTDVPAWILRFSDVINHQKLKGIWANFPEKHRKRVMDNLALFPEMHKNLRDIFTLKRSDRRSVVTSIENRMGKLNSIEHVAQSSIMIKNRLLYGTGFRADLITLLQIDNLKLNARQMSKVLSAADSTISRLLSDLRAGQLLDERNEIRDGKDRFPCLFLSSYSIWNLINLMDAQKFHSKELRRAAVESLDLRFDGFARLLLGQ